MTVTPPRRAAPLLGSAASPISLFTQLGPQYTLKDQLEKDKDDESLRSWKEQVLGGVDLNKVGGISISVTKLYGIV
ncbi:hypothetical protein I3843_16G115200 [Carya illinoinensis]|nr:hypothetical protein I3843_16G115200 [Carya illinoinensis]